VGSTLLTDAVYNSNPASSHLKSMTYSPSQGNMASTVPLFDGFMQRASPEFSSRANLHD
jgi:hypothetical protein